MKSVLRTLPFRLKEPGRLLAVCLLFGLLCAQPALGAGSVLIIDYPDYWPFFTRKEDGEMTGFFYDIVSEAMAEAGIFTSWRAYPWTRCQANVKSGESEAMITVPTPERLEYAATHPDPFYLKKLSVFTYRNHPKLGYIQSMKTLDDIKTGDLTVVTYSGNGWNDRNIKSRGIKTYEAPLLKSVWRMLANRRGDIAIEWPLAAWADIDKTEIGPSQIVETCVTFDPMPFHLMISKKTRQTRLLPEFNRIILKMKESGRMDEIVSKYTHPAR
ncbi:MAG: transporter substrate-binding domain-containing protein [Desulfovibrionaceae bacterium]|nr:transporter substrate-binding domain-containing protein [Desulfovibrionaceae bacterium]